MSDFDMEDFDEDLSESTLEASQFFEEDVAVYALDLVEQPRSMNNAEFGEWFAALTGHELLINPLAKVISFDSKQRKFTFRLTGYLVDS